MTQTTHSKTGINDYSKQATIYLFTKLQALYGGKWAQSFPNDEAIKEARKFWAADIGKLTRQDIDSGLDNLKELSVSDENFNWPDLSKILALFRGEYESEHIKWEHKSDAYKRFDKSKALEVKPLPKKEQKKVISQALKMFD